MFIQATPVPALEVIELSRLGRFCVMKHERFTETTKQKLRDHGIEPDTLHTVAFSYDDADCALARLAVEQARNRNPYVSYIFHDMGESEIIETSLGFLA